MGCGRIVAIGTHESLLANCDIYAKSAQDNLWPVADEFLSSRRQPFRRQLEAMATADSINLDTRLERREFLVYSLETESDNETLLLKTYGLEMRLPVAAGPALRHALSERSFSPRGLPEGLDDEGRLTLSRRLLREGLAILASP
jgi:hypothetical protein